jgi:hypothetical protein
MTTECNQSVFEFHPPNLQTFAVSPSFQSRPSDCNHIDRVGHKIGNNISVPKIAQS